MFCRNCGNPMSDRTAVCHNCGVRAGVGVNYCPQCGSITNSQQLFCQNCGCNLGASRDNDRNKDGGYGSTSGSGYSDGNDGGYYSNNDGGYGSRNDGGYDRGYVNYSPMSQYKSKIAAGLLGIFVGGLGIHNFYLGYTTKAIIQVVASVVGIIFCGIPTAVVSVWGLVEGILILCDVINVDGNGNPLRE